MTRRALALAATALLFAPALVAKERAYGMSPMHHAPQPSSSNPRHFTECGGWVYFSATHLNENMLWRSGGTPETTHKVASYQLPEGSSAFGFSALSCIDDDLYFFLSSSEKPLYKVNNATGAVSFVANLPVSPTSLERIGSKIALLTPSESEFFGPTAVYALAADGSVHAVNVGAPVYRSVVFRSKVGLIAGRNVWVTGFDQPEARKIYESPWPHVPTELYSAGPFMTWRNQSEEIYVSDGTWQGTQRLATGIRVLKVSGQRLYMFDAHNLWSWSPADPVMRLLTSTALDLWDQSRAVAWSGGLAYIVRDPSSQDSTVFWTDGGSNNFSLGTFTNLSGLYGSSDGPLYVRHSFNHLERLEDPFGTPVYFSDLSVVISGPALATSSGLFTGQTYDSKGTEPWILTTPPAGRLMLANIAPEEPSGTIYGTLTVGGVPATKGTVRWYDDTGKVHGGVNPDSGGNFELNPVPSGTWYVTAFASEPAGLSELWDGTPCSPECSKTLGTPIEVQEGFSTGPVEIDLTPGAQLSGTLFDGSVPTPWEIIDIYDSSGTLFAGAQSGADGQYRTIGLPPGTYYVIHDDHAGIYNDQLYDGIYCDVGGCDPLQGTPVTLTGTEVRTLDIQMIRLDGTRLSGSIVADDTGDPVPSQVTISSTESWFVTYQVTTDENGNWMSPPLQTGGYIVSVDPNSGRYFEYRYGYGPCAEFNCNGEPGTPQQAIGGETTAVGEARLRLRFGRISGTVVDAVSGAPIPGVNVSLETGGLEVGTTDAAGNYSMIAPEGEHILYAQTSHRAFHYGRVYGGSSCIDTCDPTSGTTLSVTIGEVSTADFALDPKPVATITGTVTSTLGEPLAGINVNLGSNFDTTVTDTSGHYRVTSPFGGGQSLSFSHPDHFSEVAFREVALGGTAVVDMTMTRLTYLFIDFVRDDNGEPWPIPSVSHNLYDESWNFVHSSFGQPRVRPGRYTVHVTESRAQREAYSEIACETVPCPGATFIDLAEGSEVRITMGLTAKFWHLHGRVTDAAGRGIGGATIDFDPTTTGRKIGADENGYYTYFSDYWQNPPVTFFAYAPGHTAVDSSGAVCISGPKCGNATVRNFDPGNVYEVNFVLGKTDVTDVSPERVSSFGEKTITITGNDLPQNATLYLGELQMSQLSRSPQQIVATAPAGSDGWKDLKIQSVSGEIRIPHAVRYVTPVRGDFSNDGHADLFWRNGANGANAIWFLDDAGNVSGTLSLPGVYDLNWKLVGTGDFNGDLEQDLVWRHLDGGNAVWFLREGQFIGAGSLPGTFDGNWKIAGVADFNGDHKSDLLWWNQSSGELAVWIMNGLSTITTASLPAVADTRWQPEGAPDMNGDGKPDVMWRNQTTGELAVWLMNGAFYQSSVMLPAVSDLDWQVAALADYNGDKQTDIVWRNRSDGANAIWIMNGTSYVSSVPLPGLADQSWQIVAP